MSDTRDFYLSQLHPVYKMDYPDEPIQKTHLLYNMYMKHDIIRAIKEDYQATQYYAIVNLIFKY